MSSKAWTVTEINKYSRQAANDVWNCGVYCVKYLEALIDMKMDNLHFAKSAGNMSNYRDDMYEVVEICKNNIYT